MSVRMMSALSRHLGELRHEPTAKRVRGLLGGEVVVDTRAALLVWEPRRVVPTYAVPVDDVLGTLVGGTTAPTAADSVGLAFPDVSDRPILDPSIPFGVHTAPGESVEVRSPDGRRSASGFRPADPDLAGSVVLDFDAFAWLEEDEPVVSHPHDPFTRIDVLRSSRHVRLERDGQVLADSTRPRLLFETFLPVRFYLPRDDVQVELRPSATRTWCAYKGEASYWSPVVGGRELTDLAWSYEAPLHDAHDVEGLVCFFDERVDAVLDGERRERPLTPWS